MHETSTLPEDSTLSDSNGPETTETSDIPPAPVADDPPPDVLEIVASLEAEGLEEAQTSEDVPPAVEAMEVADADAAEVVDVVGVTEHLAVVNADEATGPLDVPAEVAEAQTSAEPRDEPAPSAEDALPRRTRVPAWPFLAYLALWIAGGIAAGWLLTQTSVGLPVFGTELYRTVVVVGLGLTAIGPLLILIVWLALMLGNRGASHAGLFTGSLLRGALATLCGVAIWWAVLLIIDTIRLGRPL